MAFGGDIVSDNIFVSAQQEAYSFIREKILLGEYSAGMHIRPDAVAEHLSISRMPIREALRQLESEGLVALRPNRGAVVIALSAAEAEELIEIRATLEGMALRYAMPVLKGAVLEDLVELHDRMERVHGDPKTWLDRHIDFHQFIAAKSGRKHIITLLTRIQNQLLPATYALIMSRGSEELGGAEHGILLDAIKSGRVSLAENTIRNHIQEFSSALSAFLNSDGAVGAGTSAEWRKAS